MGSLVDNDEDEALSNQALGESEITGTGYTMTNLTTAASTKLRAKADTDFE